MKKLINISFVLLLCLCLITGCGKKKAKDTETNEKPVKEEIKVNTTATMDQTVEEFKIEDVNLFYDKGETFFEAYVTNTLSTESSLRRIRVHIMNGDDEIANLPGFIGGTLKPNEQRLLTASKVGDYTDATSIRYEIVR